MKNYNTQQKNALLDFLKKRNGAYVSINEISGCLDLLAKSTLYRLLGRLEEEGVLESAMVGGNKCYAYRPAECHAHLHMTCSVCGRCIHLDEKESLKLKDSLLDATGFELDLFSSVLFGVCKECRT